jgi:hypothetical protein
MLAFLESVLVFVAILLTAVDATADSNLFLPIPVPVGVSPFGLLPAHLVTGLFLQYRGLAVYEHNVHGFP